MKYRCIKELYIDKYDGDGFSTGGWFVIPVGSIWETDASPHRIVGGNDTIHLDLIEGEPKGYWIEILGTTLTEHFEMIDKNLGE